MQVLNKTSKTLISKECKKAESLWDQFFGLLNPKNPCSLLFETRFGIHTFFLKQNIDILVLNNNLKVVKIKKSLKPNRLFFWNPSYNLVLELPFGVIKKSGTKIGDQLVIYPQK